MRPSALIALSVGDSGFACLTAVDRYGAVNLVDAGWVAGFLILAVAAVVDDVADEAGWPDEIGLSVNFAGESLTDPALGARVAHALADHGVAPDQLSIEVLESSVIEQDRRALTSVRALRALGVRVAETPVQLAAALAAGCDDIQGFLWGMPASAAHCHELIGRMPVLETDWSTSAD